MKKKAQSFTIGANAAGTVTYKVTKTPSKAAKYISVSNAGKVTLKKGAKAGTYTIQVLASETAGYKAASSEVTIKVEKNKQTIKTKFTSKKVKASTLKKKAATVNISATAKGKLSYKVTSTPKNGKKYISVSKTGKVTMKKKAPKGTYVITITAKATATYAKAVKTVKLVVK